MAKSSINLQLAKFFALLHNTREAIVTYVVADANRNDYDRNGEEAFKYYLDLLKEASKNYTKRTKQRIQTDKKKFIWEAVVNLNHDHELKDLEDLAKVLESIYGWQAIQLNIHRDEGRIDKESGENIYNFHGHIVFFMLNKDGIYCFKKRDFGIKRMQELQTIVANVLNMERGISKTKTKTIRLEHPQYRQVKQAEEKMEIRYDQQEKQLNDLTIEITKLRENKKKTASTIRRTARKNMTNDNEWQKLRLFYMNSMGRLSRNSTNKYLFVHTDELSDSDLILEWIKASEKEILFLRTENLMLTNEFTDINEEVYNDLESEYNDLCTFEMIDNEEYDCLTDPTNIDSLEYFEKSSESSEMDVEMFEFHSDLEDDEDDYHDPEHEDLYCEDVELNYDDLPSQINNEKLYAIEDEEGCVDDEQLETTEDFEDNKLLKSEYDNNEDSKKEFCDNEEVVFDAESKTEGTDDIIEDEKRCVDEEQLETSEDINDYSPIKSEHKQDEYINEILSCRDEECESMSAKEMLSILDKDDPLLESIKRSMGDDVFEEVYRSIIDSKSDPTTDDLNIDKKNKKKDAVKDKKVENYQKSP